MKRKPDLLDEKEKTQDAVAQITSWCIAVAVHQRYGVGRDRLERGAAGMATAAWCCFAVGMRDVLGFGTERLNAVRAEALLNYRQFNEWAREDDEDFM